MKGALLISGQLRTFDKCFSNIYDNVILPNDFDVFLFIDSRSEDIPEHIFNIINKNSCIKKVEFMNSSDNREFSVELENIMNKKSLVDLIIKDNCNISSIQYYLRNGGSILEYYQFLKCYKIMEEYEKIENINYGFVMRGRFDMAFSEKFDIINFYKNVLPNLIISNKEKEVEPEHMGCHKEDCNRRFEITNNFSGQLSFMFRHMIDTGNIKSNKSCIFSVRGNQIWAGLRDDMNILKNLIYKYGDYDNNDGRQWDSECHFHNFITRNGLVHIDYYRAQDALVFTNKEKNQNFLKNFSGSQFTLVRLPNYNF